MERTHSFPGSISAIIHMLKLKKRREKRANLPWAKSRCLCAHVFLLLPLLKPHVWPVGSRPLETNGNDRNLRQQMLLCGLRHTGEMHRRKVLLGSHRKIWPTRLWSNRAQDNQETETFETSSSRNNATPPPPTQ